MPVGKKGFSVFYIDIDKQEFYDDAQVLVKSFYPGVQVSQLKEDTSVQAEDKLIKLVAGDMAGKTKSEAHDLFKKNLYCRLSEETKKTLPWGYLTGVRPSKIAYTMLEQGADRQTVLNEFTDRYLTDSVKAELAVKVAKTELDILEKLDYKNGYSLYIGIPFCPTTCLYCSFTSYSLAAYEKKVDEYITALIKEMEFVADYFKDKRLDTVYFGGGTPTTLNPEQLDRLLGCLFDKFDMSGVAELTVEAGRPDSVTRQKLEVLKKYGVSRISINPQTMNDKTLELIGRRHSSEQVKEAFRLAREIGFDNINMDIILGLPGEGENEVRYTLEQIKELAPESLTVHSLAIKRAAALNIWKEKYAQLKVENSEKIVEMAASYARQMGAEPYYMYRQKNMAGNLENVGYSVKGLECIYNILIMEEKQTIIACGAGASTKVVFHDDDGVNNRIERIESVKNVDIYIERIDEMIQRKKAFFEKEQL